MGKLVSVGRAHGELSQQERSERFWEAGFFENLVCGNARTKLAINGDRDLGLCIPPNLVITAPASLEFVSCGAQPRDEVPVIIGHAI
jgi:hypothetical protein